MNNILRSIKTKNIISGALVIGGLAAGILSANMIVKATEAQSRSNQSSVNDTISELLVSIKDIKSEEQLIQLVLENGTQVLFDDGTGAMFIAYVNQSNQVEIAETTEEELIKLIQEAQAIFEESGAAMYSNQNNTEDYKIPEEYYRDNQQNKVEKKNRIRLDSEEGRLAVEKARAYKKNNNK